ncbi:MAG: ABC transporter substrate-binding protein/permease [Puniceicoccales bacterium]|jgi:polar amino acid transport system substrate-binding protein|nr:ABC transporter substrate-binding protein/permease [Puniceicoccales bacterium]
MKKFLIAVFLTVGCALSADDSLLRWAADAESGAPNVYYDNGDLASFVGFEKEIIEKIAEVLGRRAVFHQNDWDCLFPGLKRNLYDVIINGIAVDETGLDGVIFSDPYYACKLALIVHAGTSKIKSVLDCNGTVVGVLRNVKTESILVNNLKNVETIGYPNEYCALSDLENGRVDAVLLDGQIASYYVARMKNLKIVDEFEDVRYSVVSLRGHEALMGEINGAIDRMKKDGSLDAIVTKWNLYNDSYARILSPSDGAATNLSQGDEVGKSRVLHPKIRYAKMLPFFLKAAGVTLILSSCAMTVAVILGIGLAILRVYTPKWIGFTAIFAIEFLRGTPLLIQLFFMFYGLPFIGITLPPMATGILTLGINYAAYEAENFRAGMAAVPCGQMEAARALGMSQGQSLRHIILPQAFRFILPPLTNDFIALLKDSSLVSLITIVELAKTYTIVASNSMDFFGTGAIVALIYFLIGLPFVRLARLAEKHLKLEKRAYSSRKSGKT